MPEGSWSFAPQNILLGFPLETRTGAVAIESRGPEVTCVMGLCPAEAGEIAEGAAIGGQNEAEPTQTLMMRLSVSEPLLPVTVTL